MAFPPPNYVAAPYDKAVGFLEIDLIPQPMLVYFQHTSGAVFSLHVTASETALSVKRRLQVQLCVCVMRV